MVPLVQSLNELESKVFSAIDVLRDEIEVRDYTVLLFLLQLRKDGHLSNLSEEEACNIKAYLHSRIENSKSYHDVQINKIFDSFRYVIDSLMNGKLFDIYCILDSLNYNSLFFNYQILFENLLYKINALEGRHTGEYLQPLEISNFLITIANINDGAEVYNPFAGLDTFGVFLPDSVNYHGRESNQRTVALSKLRVLANNKLENININCEDSIQYWDENPSKYDFILTSPPFNKKINQVNDTHFGLISSLESFIISKSLTSLKNKGKLIIVLPTGFLFRGGAEINIRKYLVENDFVDMVISFPAGLLSNTLIPFCVLVLNKLKAFKNEVLFINAEPFVEKINKRESKFAFEALADAISNRTQSHFLKIVQNNEIKAQEYNLNVNRYFLENIEGVTLSEILTFNRGIRVRDKVNGKFIRVRDLKNDKLDFSLVLNDIEEVEIPMQGFKISSKVLLLSLRWNELKPTYFQFDDEPIFIPSDISAWTVNEEKVDIEFLINELSSPTVVDQISRLRSGGAIPSISKQDLMKVKINLPSIDLQRAQVKGAKEALLNKKQEEIEQFKKFHGLENEILAQNSFLRHSIAGSLKNIRSSFKDLKDILHNQVLTAIPDLMNFKAGDKTKLTVDKHLEILERDIQKISQISKSNGVDEILEHSEMIDLNIVEFIKTYVSEVKNRAHLIFDIELLYEELGFPDLDDIYISADPNLLRILLDNLVQNAENHGFSGIKRASNHIALYLEPIFDDKSCWLTFGNSGKGLPSNFTRETFTMKGAKAGSNAGDGMGGYMINKIIEMHDGQLDIYDHTIENPSMTFADEKTAFFMTFPIIEI